MVYGVLCRIVGSHSAFRFAPLVYPHAEEKFDASVP